MEDKRDRCSNFTYDDIDLLISLAEEKKSILECKRTDAVSNKTKDCEWEKLAVTFNTKATEMRTAKMLRAKWESLKKSSRKEIASAKQYQRGTGGGPSGKFKKCPWTNRIVCLMGISATGKTNVFDSDGENINTANKNNYAASTPPEPEILNVEPVIINENSPVLITELGYNTDKSRASSNIPDWGKWNPIMLRQPTNDALQIKMGNVPVESCPLSIPNISNATNRRRPVLKRKSNTSPAAETNKKFSALAENKLELVKIQIELAQKESEARMKMEAEKHVLEMKILEVELKIKEKQLLTIN